MGNKKEPRFVTVTWLDAWADGVDDVTPENVKDKHKPIEMETRGWLLVDDEEGVSVFYERVKGTSNYRGRTFVLRGMIKSIEDFPAKRRYIKNASKLPVSGREHNSQSVSGEGQGGV